MTFARVGSLLRQVRRMAGVPDNMDLSDRDLLRTYARDGDAAAFARLLERHGPLVWGVCRRVLRNEQDAEDAFQATFLVLASKAGSTRWSKSAAGWLYEVARRIAENARRLHARRLLMERTFAAERTDVAREREPLHDEANLLAEELARLPQKYRAPLVLCYLQGLSHPEAARQLGWPVGTVKGRLARAREELRQRLGRRGVTAPVTALVLAIKSGAVPTRIVEVTLRVAVLAAGGSVTAPGRASVLAQEVLQSMRTEYFKTILALVAGLSIVGAGASLAARQAPDHKQTAESSTIDPSARLAGDDDASLPAGAIARFGTRRLRHGGIIEFLAFSPDGKTLVSQSSESVRVWDAATGKELRRFSPGDRFSIRSADLAGDGRHVAIRQTADRFAELAIWDLTTGRLVQKIELSGDRSGWPKVRFSPDARRFALYGTGTGIELWNAETGKQIATLDGAALRALDAVFTPDGKSLIAGGDDKVLHVWDTAAGKRQRDIGSDLDEVWQLAMSPDGAVLGSVSCHYVSVGASGYWPPDDFVRLWDLRSGKLLPRIAMPARTDGPKPAPSGINSLLFTPEGRQLLTATLDGSIRIWNIASGAEVRQLPDQSAGSPRWHFTFTPDGKRIAYAAGSMICLRDFRTGADLFPEFSQPIGIDFSVLSDDGRVVATAAGAKVFLWDAASGRRLPCPVAHEKHVKALAFTDGGRTLLSAGDDGTLRASDLVTGRETRRFALGDVMGFHWKISHDRKLLALQTKNQSVLVLDTETNREVLAIAGDPGQVSQFLFAPDDRVLYACHRDYVIHVHDLRTGKEVRVLQADVGSGSTPPLDRLSIPYSSALSPNGRILAIGNQSRHVMLLDVVSGTVLRRLDGTDGIPAIAFSPDGKTLAWGDWSDGSVGLYDVFSGQERYRIRGHEGRIFSLVFSRDGRRLITASQDCTALVWDLAGPLDGKSAQPLTTADLQDLRNRLSDDDASRVYQAIRSLSARPQESVPFLGKTLSPLKTISDTRIRELIASLDSDQFAERERASGELRKGIDTAVPLLRKALEDRMSEEARRRLTSLIEFYNRDELDATPERLLEMRVLEVLELAGTAQARSVLEEWARGAPGARRTRDAKAALTRLCQPSP